MRGDFGSRFSVLGSRLDGEHEHEHELKLKLKLTAQRWAAIYFISSDELAG